MKGSREPGNMPVSYDQKQRLVDIGNITAQQAKDWGFNGVMLRGSGVCWDLQKAAHYDVHDQLDPDIPVEQGCALPHRRQMRGNVHGGASGFQCTASKIRASLSVDHYRRILELGCWIRDPRSRLDEDPAERGQSLETTGWGVEAKNGLMNRSPRTGHINLLIVEAASFTSSRCASSFKNQQTALTSKKGDALRRNGFRAAATPLLLALPNLVKQPFALGAHLFCLGGSWRAGLA
ncbi:hypothetical protein KY289_008229 [Solanum tuberosum]|nr:hypothetical protein KY289_008229 [Solanum tuberosum]